MTTPYTVHTGDCRDVLRDYPADHFDSIVSDPPYGLSFMGKGWDRGVPGVEFWQEALRVAKPGAHLLAFGGTRTFHRLTVAIEDAGWEVRDCMMWLYGSGFPKSHDVSKAIDKINGHWRGRAGEVSSGNTAMGGPNYERTPKEDPITPEAAAWQGWGTALKPAWEPVIVARKPLSGTVADNVLRYGTGGLNIDGCRVGTTKRVPGYVPKVAKRDEGKGWGYGLPDGSNDGNNPNVGRWPANVMHDGSAEVVAGFPDAKSGIAVTRNGGGRIFGSDRTYSGRGGGVAIPDSGYTDSGSAARFFYCAKASRTDREEGCDHLPARSGFEAVERKEGSSGLNSPRAGASAHAEAVRNFHPTVKPTDLMRYLCRLVTPPAGLVLDPFCGSGSTGKAALLEGLRFVGVDLDPAHVAIAKARCQFAVDTVEEQAAAAEAPGAQLALF